MQLERLTWQQEEVLAYLEDAITSNTATQYEVRFYENYKWNNEFNINSRTYKMILRNMKQQYVGEEF